MYHLCCAKAKNKLVLSAQPLRKNTATFKTSNTERKSQQFVIRRWEQFAFKVISVLTTLLLSTHPVQSH